MEGQSSLQPASADEAVMKLLHTRRLRCYNVIVVFSKVIKDGRYNSLGGTTEA